MRHEGYEKSLEWLKTRPSLDELCSRYPGEWAAVQRDISAIVERGVAEELKASIRVR